MRALHVITLLAVIGFFVSCTTPPKVAQGSVIGWDKAGNVMSVKDESDPEKTFEFSLAGAEIGAEPHSGDIVRVAYYGEQGRLTATRVMNISRQKDLKGSK